MRVVDFSSKEISNCKLSNYIQIFKSNNYNHTYLKGDFFIDGNIFLPILMSYVGKLRENTSADIILRHEGVFDAS